jgi:5'-deoxynucleotidase YfbR-like HD superfamily hydrolase
MSTQKNSAKNSTQNAKENQTLKIDLKKFNLENIAPKTRNGENKTNGLYNYFENEKSNSAQRTKFRNKLERLTDNIIFAGAKFEKENSKENEKEFLAEIEAFKTEYQHRYKIQDYSIESVLNSNARPAFRNKVAICFEIIKSISK